MASTTPSTTMEPNTVLGLPVDTFAYILVGIGLGGAVLFIIIYCVAKIYCKGRCCQRGRRRHSPKHRSKIKSVQELWEQDTLKRKRDLEAAGYVNDAFKNMEELDVLSLENYPEYKTQDSNGIIKDSLIMNGNTNFKQKSRIGHSVSSDNIYKKKKQSNLPVRLSKSSPPAVSNVPVLQVNGEVFNHSEYDQMPRNKLGSSLVRIEEEVIIEEELDVQKDKSKKKLKGSKKNHLTPNLSSDGYPAEEDAGLTLQMHRPSDPPTTVLTSEVVVHVDNESVQDVDENSSLSSSRHLGQVEIDVDKHSGLKAENPEKFAYDNPAYDEPLELGVTQQRAGTMESNQDSSKSDHKPSSDTLGEETKLLKDNVSNSVEQGDILAPCELSEGQSDQSATSGGTEASQSVTEQTTTSYSDEKKSESLPRGTVTESAANEILNSGVESETSKDTGISVNNNETVLKQKHLLDSHLINNNVHYTLDSKPDSGLQLPNGITKNSGINGLKLTGKDSGKFSKKIGSVADNIADSETDKLQSWLHDVYVAKTTSTNQV